MIQAMPDMCVCVCVHVHLSAFMGACIDVLMYKVFLSSIPLYDSSDSREVCVYVCAMSAFMGVCIYVCIHGCMYLCIYVFMYSCIKVFLYVLPLHDSSDPRGTAQHHMHKRGLHGQLMCTITTINHAEHTHAQREREGERERKAQ
jgi:hypothetical protein